ncbi:MAG TPA: glutamate synthase subunit alpha, partial [Chloroflexi bacterium]|nr:glutamate synthase subunit alpha [Chloroflexota bacterium]
AETQQTLVLNGLRSRVALQVDGGLKTGRDVIIGALLGADEFGFSTAPLIAAGCIMMRKCHLNTCPVGVATQDPVLRKRFKGLPEHVINYFFFVANDVREILAAMGYRSLNEIIGCSELLDKDAAIDHWKARGLDFTRLFHKAEAPREATYWTERQDHPIADILDRELIASAKPALETRQPMVIEATIKNVDRSAGAMLSGEVAKRYGQKGLKDDTITVRLKGTAGQSFGAFLARGITFDLEGDGNDYVGKGLSGGRIIIRPPENARIVPETSIIVGNTVLYGATTGECYFRGVAGERFAVRNSGAIAVVEGVGDHGCEYMTGGRVVVLGKTGRNFAAGMSGGIAYVLDWEGDFKTRINYEMVGVETLEDAEEIAEVKALIQKHADLTNSELAWRVLIRWDDLLPQFVKVMPKDYKRVLEAFAQVKAQGLSGEEAVMAAFEQNKRDVSRVGGN